MNTIETEIVNTTEQIGGLVDQCDNLTLWSRLYIDLEGIDLCREGSISILTLLIHTGFPTQRQRVHLIDVHTLGAQAFNTTGARKKTLKDVLEDEHCPKVFFDVRNDSDALFAHFGIALRGVEDVQLMESATRKTTASRKFVNGLARCIEDNPPTSSTSIASWKVAKEKGERLFKSEYGGSYDVFNARPIPEDIVSYCVGDVQYLPHLRDSFSMRQNDQWLQLVSEASMKRVAESQSPDYQPHGKDRAVAPWTKEQNSILDQKSQAFLPLDDFDEFYDLHDRFIDDFGDLDNDPDDDPYYDWYDDGPTGCRDIINDCDMHLYYSD